MDAYRLFLDERTRVAKVIASSNPTTENLTAYGQAIMEGWDDRGKVCATWRCGYCRKRFESRDIVAVTPMGPVLTCP